MATSAVGDREWSPVSSICLVMIYKICHCEIHMRSIGCVVDSQFLTWSVGDLVYRKRLSPFFIYKAMIRDTHPMFGDLVYDMCIWY